MNQQPNYGQQPMYQQQPQGPVAPIMTVMDWVKMYLIMCIPIYGFIMMFVWAFGGKANPNLANYMKAALIIAAIILVLEIVLFVVFGFGAALLGGLAGAAGGY